MFGTNFDKHHALSPSLCLSPTEGRNDLKPEYAGKLRGKTGKIPSPWRRRN
jgi:hypothetical protein